MPDDLKTFVDLFAGIGGFRIALESAGLSCLFTSEIDENSRWAYEQNFGDHNIYGDIKKIDAKDIPPHDVLCAGFPCQSFSISGKRDGMESDNGRLFFEIVRIAKYHQPKVILLENVRNILSIDNGDVIRTIEKELTDIGYNVRYDTLNASHFGFVQSRKRVYFVSLHKSAGLQYRVPMPVPSFINLCDILQDDSEIDDNLYSSRKNRTFIKDVKRPIQYHPAPIRLGHYGKGGQGDRIYHPHGHAVTITSNGGGSGGLCSLYYINGRVRNPSAIECRRIMGFPDNFILSIKKKGLRQLGNAVIPGMIRILYNSIEACEA